MTGDDKILSFSLDLITDRQLALQRKSNSTIIGHVELLSCNLLSEGLDALSFNRIWFLTKLCTFLSNHAYRSSHAVAVAIETGLRPRENWQLTGFIPGNARSSCM